MIYCRTCTKTPDACECLSKEEVKNILDKYTPDPQMFGTKPFQIHFYSSGKPTQNKWYYHTDRKKRDHHAARLLKKHKDCTLGFYDYKRKYERPNTKKVVYE